MSPLSTRRLVVESSSLAKSFCSTFRLLFSEPGLAVGVTPTGVAPSRSALFLDSAFTGFTREPRVGVLQKLLLVVGELGFEPR